MALTWFGEPEIFSRVSNDVENVFAMIYLIEAVILITVYGRFYFKDGWRQFDFLIVVLSLINLVLQFLNFEGSNFMTLIRSFRILRPIKMVRRLKLLRQIINTIQIALPNLVQVGSLLLLFVEIYAVLGVYLFAKLKLDDFGENGHITTGLSSHANFQSMPTAMLTLLRMTTGEAWNELMWSCMRPRSILFQCQEKEQKYAEIEKNGVQNCGSQASYMYFISFIVVCVFFMTNMFISIILDGYNASRLEE